jgi:hypothetical protein
LIGAHRLGAKSLKYLREVKVKKYEFTGEILSMDGRTLRRIRRISDGLSGGYIETEDNLSQDGSCFIYNEALVYGDARVCGEARVYGGARVYGEAQVFGDARVCGEARVYGGARVYGDAKVYGVAQVSGRVWVYGEALVYGEARVCGEARVSDKACVYGEAQVYGEARVYDEAKVYGDAQVYGDAKVYGGVKVSKTPTLITGLKYNITVTSDYIFIGCEGHTIDYWRHNIWKIGRKHNYTDAEIRQTILFIRAALANGGKKDEA